MKRKLLALLSFVLIVAIACTSCDALKNIIPDSSDLMGDCEHTYSDKWSTSATEHWHAATCEHAELKSGVASHVDADENGKCDVCDYEIGHEHTYAEAWSSDETHHWKVATCSHSDQKGELAKHTDANFDNTCDVCSAALTVEAPADIAAAIELVLLRAGAISGGKLHYEYLGGNHEDVDPHAKKDIDYIFGTDSLYMSVSSWAKQPNGFTADLTDFVTESDVMKGWYQLLDDNTVFSVTQTSYDDYVGDFELNTGADVNTMKGYYCAVSTLVDAYGAENLLAALYGLSQSNGASEYVTTFDATNLTYTFSFAYLAVNTDTAEGEGDHVDYYEVEVSFTYNQNGALTALTVVADCYTNSLANEEENDYTYDQNSGTITMKDTALADTYTFVFTQTVGERTYVNENPKSKFVPTDYDFFEDEACTSSINGTVTVTQNTNASVFVGGFLPEGASIEYVVDLVSLEGDESLHLWTYGNQIGMYANNVGTYTVNFSVAGVSKSFTVVVEAGSSAGGGTDQPDGNSIAVDITDNNGWFDLVEFTAPTSGDYTFVVPAGCGAYGLKEYNAFGEAFVDPDHPFRDDSNGGSFTVSIAEGETYKFYVKSPEKNVTVYITYTVSDYTGSGAGGSDIPESTLIIGYNNINATDVAFAYTASGAGKLTLTAGNAIMAPVEMAYSVNGGASTPLALGSSVELTLASGDKVVITVIAEGYSTLTAAWAAESAGEGGDSDITLVQGTYTGTDEQGTSTLTVIVGETTVTFNYTHPMHGPSSVTVTYEVIGTEVVLYDENGNVLNPLAGLLEINAAGVPVSADYSGNSYALTAGGSSEGGEGGEEGNGFGTEEDPYVLDTLPESISFNSDTINKVYYIFTAAQTGHITFTWPTADSWVDIFELDENGDLTQNSGSIYETTSFSFNITEGTTYRFSLGTWMISGDVTITITTGEGTVGGGEGGEGGEGGNTEEIVIDGYLYLDETVSVTVTEAHLTAGKIYLSFYSADAGEYSFLGDLYISSLTDAEGNVVEMNDNYRYELESYTSYTVCASTSYISVAGNYDVAVKYIYPEGRQQNPFWYYIGESAIATYKGDYNTVWYEFVASATGTLVITDLSEVDSVTLMVCAVFGSEMTNVTVNEETWESIYAKTLSMPVVQGRTYYIGVAAFESVESVDIAFSASITEGDITTDGTANVPHNVVVGTNNAKVPQYGNVYFAYKAEANGTLNLTSTSDICAWYVVTDLNEGTYAVPGDLSIHLYYGETAYIYIEASDWSEATIPFTASFEADPTEVYFDGQILTDGTANELVIENNTWVVFSVMGAGQYTISWDNTDAKVELIDWFAGNTTLENGGVFTGNNWGVDIQVSLPEYAAGTVKITITPCTDSSDGTEVGEGDGTATAPFALEATNSCDFPGGWDYIFYTYTAETAGTLTINITSADYFWGYGSGAYSIDNVGSTISSLPITLKAGQTVYIGISTNSTNAGVVEFTSEFTA